MKIKHSLFIAFFILFLVPLIILQIGTMNYYDGKMEQILENDLTVAASTQVEAIDNFCEEREADLNMFSKYDIIQELLELSNEKNIQQFSEKRNYFDNILNVRSEENYSVESITILDTSFRIVSCSQWVEPGEVSVLAQVDEKYFDKSVRFTKVIETQNGGETKRSMAAIQEIYQDEKLIGYAVEEINLNFFEQVRESAKLFNNGTIYIIDDAGSLIAAGDSHETRKEYVLSEEERTGFKTAWAQRDPDAKSGILRYEELGTQYMSYYSGFQYTDWTLITTVSVDEVLQRKAGYHTLGLMLLVCLPALLLTANYFLSEKLGKPMDNMVEKFGRIKASEDYSIRMNYSSKNELGIISSEVDSLLSYIEKNIKKEKQKQETLKEIAERDPLTNLYNKKAIEEILKEELEKAERENRQTACVFIDIDNFKDFNTRYGHLGGDKVLLFVANILSGLGYPAGRIGGDEFVLCVNKAVEKEELEEMSREIIDILKRGVNMKNNLPPVSITTSIGIAVSRKGQGWEELLERADQAMYHVKNTEKNDFYII